jgi:hypothetical protein
MPDNPCPHRTITQVYDDGEPKQSWTCDTCGEQLVSLHLLLEVVKAMGKVSLGEWED